MRDLATQLAREDELENLGQLDADERTTCYICQTWAGDDHREDPAHKRRLGIPAHWSFDSREGRYRPTDRVGA